MNIQGGPAYRPARVDPKLLDRIVAGRPVDYRGSSTYEPDPEDLRQDQGDIDWTAFEPPTDDPYEEYPYYDEDEPEGEPVEPEGAPLTHRQTKQVLRSRYPKHQMSDYNLRRRSPRARNKLTASLDMDALKRRLVGGKHYNALKKSGGYTTYDQSWKNHRGAQYRPVDMAEEPEE